jgi:prophage regulatory protein
MTTPKKRRILRLPATIEKTGLGRDSIYRGAREGWFPKPVKLSERASGWLEHELDDFIAKRAAERDKSNTSAAS